MSYQTKKLKNKQRQYSFIRKIILYSSLFRSLLINDAIIFPQFLTSHRGFDFNFIQQTHKPYKASNLIDVISIRSKQKRVSFQKDRNAVEIAQEFDNIILLRRQIESKFTKGLNILSKDLLVINHKLKQHSEFDDRADQKYGLNQTQHQARNPAQIYTIYEKIIQLDPLHIISVKGIYAIEDPSILRFTCPPECQVSEKSQPIKEKFICTQKTIPLFPDMLLHFKFQECQCFQSLKFKTHLFDKIQASTRLGFLGDSWSAMKQLLELNIVHNSISFDKFQYSLQDGLWKLSKFANKARLNRAIVQQPMNSNCLDKLVLIQQSGQTNENIGKKQKNQCEKNSDQILSINNSIETENSKQSDFQQIKCEEKKQTHHINQWLNEISDTKPVKQENKSNAKNTMQTSKEKMEVNPEANTSSSFQLLQQQTIMPLNSMRQDLLSINKIYLNSISYPSPMDNSQSKQSQINSSHILWTNSLDKNIIPNKSVHFNDILSYCSIIVELFVTQQKSSNILTQMIKLAKQQIQSENEKNKKQEQLNLLKNKKNALINRFASQFHVDTNSKDLSKLVLNSIFQLIYNFLNPQSTLKDIIEFMTNQITVWQINLNIHQVRVKSLNNENLIQSSTPIKIQSQQQPNSEVVSSFPTDFSQKNQNSLDSVRRQLTIQNKFDLNPFKFQKIMQNPILPSSIQKLQFHNERLFDDLTFEQKKQFFYQICRCILKKEAINAHRNIKVFHILMDKRLLMKILLQIRCTTNQAEYSILPRIFLLCLYKKKKPTHQQSLGDIIEQIIRQLVGAKSDQELNNLINLYKNDFQFDRVKLTPDQNIIVFKTVIFFMLGKTLPKQNEDIIKSIFEEKKSKFEDTISFQSLNDNEDEDNENFSNFLLKFNENNQEMNISVIEPENPLNRQEYRKGLLRRYSQNFQFGDRFLIHNNRLFFSSIHLSSTTSNSFNLDILLNHQCSQIQGLTVPMQPFGTQGLRKICDKWPKLLTLYAWLCNIESLKDSGLEKMQNLKELGLANNLLKKDSVEYLLRMGHSWPQLEELRISFIDGSESWDIFLQYIFRPFPNLKRLYVRQMKNISEETILKILNLRIYGLQVYFRMEQSLLSKLLNLKFPMIDFESEADNTMLTKMMQQKLASDRLHHILCKQCLQKIK